MYKSLCARVLASLPVENSKDARLISPLVLAYIGDTVYDLYVRTSLIEKSDLAVHGLHRLSAQRVCAAAQAAAYHRIADKLTPEETEIYKRGRNAHMGTVPKHASISDYRAATGLEALMGYLYLRGEDERLTQLMSEIMDDTREDEA